MTTEALPAITVHPDERDRLADPRLDYPYIDRAAKYVADCLANGLDVEACFQPGDGTRYNLVFTPPRALSTAEPRHAFDTRHAPWEQHVIQGCRDNRDTKEFQPASRYYAHDAVLVSWVEHACYPIKLTNEFAADYVAQKFDTTIVSGCTLAILFRAIAHHYLTNGGLL